MRNNTNKIKLICIHGAFGNSQETKQIISEYIPGVSLIHYALPGHDTQAELLENYSWSKIMTDFEAFLEIHGPAYIFGFSLGGYLAISQALKDPKNIKGIIALGTKFSWNKTIAENEIKNLNLEQLKKIEPFYEHLNKLHGANLSNISKATKKLINLLGENPLINEDNIKELKVPLRVVRGAKDKMVGAEESLKIVSNAPSAKYFEIPSFIHPISFLNQKKLSKIINIQLKSFEYQWVKTRLGEISYQEINVKSPKTNELLIFFHEALGSIAQWKDFPIKLCKRLKTNGLILELDGYGFSSEQIQKRNSNYLHDFALQKIPEIIQQLCPDKKLIIIGHSDGGTNALLYGKKHPQNIKGIVTIAAHVINEDITKTGIKKVLSENKEHLITNLEIYHGAKTNWLFQQWSETWLSKDFENWDITKDISGISVPILSIQGELDEYGSLKQVELIKASSAGSHQEKIIPKTGHSPHLTAEEITITTIEQWNTNLA